MSVLILTGDCREVMAAHGPYDMIVADPPYGDTNLVWDRLVEGWEDQALRCLKPTGSMWVFGSMRYFMTTGLPRGWRLAQDLVWEKPAGVGAVADRFRRVHEHVVHLYPASSRWADVINEVQRRPYDGPDKHTRRRAASGPSVHGAMGAASYEDDGTRIVRSVIAAPQVRGGLHPTQKPVALLELLIRTSCPDGGLVGDFFSGSGSAGEAAIMAGRRYVGAEADPDMAEVARKRLAGNLFGAAV